MSHASTTRLPHLRTFRGLGLLALAAGFATAAAPAGAKPVVPGAVPLTILAGTNPTAVPDAALCPSAAGFDGTGGAAALRKLLRSGKTKLPPWVLGSSVAKHAVLLCDPDAARAQRFIGGLSGDVALGSEDWAWYGLRGLVLHPADGAPAALRVGDQLTLPAVGPRAVLDVAVAAGGGVRATRVPAGSTPTAVRVTGTAAAPVAEVTRADGSVWTWNPEAVVAVKPTARVRATTHGKVEIRGTAAPGALVWIGTAGRTVLATSSGRFTSQLSLPRRNGTLDVLAIDRPTRNVIALQCKIRWNQAAKTHRAATCRTSASHEQPTIGEGAAASRTSFDAAVSDRSPRTRASAARAHAGRKPALVPTDVTTVFSTHNFAQTEFTGGDLNGDGRPDFSVSKFGKANKSSLLVSQGTGWKAVKLIRNEESGFESFPDISGDGRGELRADDNAFVTDAFSSATLPASIDLSKKRQTSPADVVPPTVDLGGLFDLDASWLSWVHPVGTVSDVTGDGRAEIVNGDGPPLVIASDDLRPGIRMNAAHISPVVTFDDLDLKQAVNDELLRFGSTEEEDWDEARTSLSTLARGGVITAVAAVDRTRPATELQPMEVFELNARGERSALRRFTAAGVPLVLDADPATGDVLVRLLGVRPCKEQSIAVGMPKPCKERVLRIDGSGRVEATINVERWDQGALSAAFVTDGSDADGRLETLVSTGSGLNQAAPQLLASVQQGTFDQASLPVLSEDGKPLEGAAGFSVVVLADGSRWISTLDMPTWDWGDPVPPERTLLLQPR